MDWVVYGLGGCGGVFVGLTLRPFCLLGLQRHPRDGAEALGSPVSLPRGRWEPPRVTKKKDLVSFRHRQVVQCTVVITLQEFSRAS